jgi:mRNA interferase MazF
MTYDPYSIVVVPFPFTDLGKTKKRPALVLSSLQHQQQTGHVTLLMITTAAHSAWPSDCRLQDLLQAGLSKPSIARQKIFTIDSRLIIKPHGKLSSHDENEVKKHLRSHIF